MKNMKEIKLTQDKLAIVDDEDFERVNQYKWCYMHDGRVSHTFHTGYKDLTKPKRPFNQKNKTIRLHRFILNFPEGMEIDHINGNVLDNRKTNLRICNHSQNLKNCKISKNNTSGYKGITWRKDCNKWFAYIVVNYKQIGLGYFFNKLDAATAYNVAAKKYHGEFARLNLSKDIKKDDEIQDLI